MFRRVSRLLFTFASAVSMALCVTTTVLWVRSYWRWDRLRQESILTEQWSGWMVESAHGSLTFGRKQVDGLPSDERQWDSFSVTTAVRPLAAVIEGREYRWSRLGFSHSDQTGFDVEGTVRFWQKSPAGTHIRPLPARAWTFTLPFWPLAAVTAMAAVPSARGLTRLWRRARRATLGLCPRCGYDLRATPDRCPECGTAVASDNSGHLRRVREFGRCGRHSL